MKKSQLRRIIREEIEKVKQLTIDFPEDKPKSNSNGEIANHVKKIIDRVRKNKSFTRIVHDMNDIKQWASSVKDIDHNYYEEELDDIWAMESDMTSPGWAINYLQSDVKPEDAAEVLRQAAEGIKTELLNNREL